MLTATKIVKEYRKFERSGGLFGATKDLFFRKYTLARAVDEISFHIPEGEIAGFIGPNGAGKTTTIKMLTGIMHPSSGEIEVAGFTPARQRAQLAKNIGVLFGKRSNLMWDLPVVDAFQMLSDLFEVKKSDSQARIAQLKQIVQIEPLLKTPVRKLSLGQRTLCEVVASVIHRPKVLFLDEPTIGLDLFAKDQVRDLVQFVNEEWGMTVFLTTHDLSDIRKLARQVILISSGKKIYDGTLHDLLEKANELDRQIIIGSKADLRQKIMRLQGDQGIREINPIGPHKLEITYSPGQLSTMQVIQLMMNKLEEIHDIQIPITNIEEIIRHMYRSGEAVN